MLPYLMCLWEKFIGCICMCVPMFTCACVYVCTYRELLGEVELEIQGDWQCITQGTLNQFHLMQYDSGEISAVTQCLWKRYHGGYICKSEDKKNAEAAYMPVYDCLASANVSGEMDVKCKKKTKKEHEALCEMSVSPIQ